MLWAAKSSTAWAVSSRTAFQEFRTESTRTINPLLARNTVDGRLLSWLVDTELGFDARDPIVQVDHRAGEGVELHFKAVEPGVNPGLQTIESGIRRAVMNHVQQDSGQYGNGRHANRQVKLNVCHYEYCTVPLIAV